MKEIELRDWEHYKEYVAESFGGSSNFIFRGHADRDWKLESTLTRLSQRVSSDIQADSLELFQLKNFRMKIRGLRGVNPQPLDDNGLWSLGQHYGLCTPLLDWTESPYIAAYFAFESADACKSKWRTIIALDRVKLLKQKHVYADGSFEFIEPLHDENNRIIAQAGLFTKIPTNTSLEKWLQEKNMDDLMTKIHVESEFRLDVINDLKLMNIWGSSIYPDLHGASKACNMFIETLSENHEFGKSVAVLMKEIFPDNAD